MEDVYFQANSFILLEIRIVIRMCIFMQIHIFDNIIKKGSLGRKSFYL